MSRKLITLLVGIVLLSIISGCSSPDKGQTAKDVLQDWRSQNFNPIEETTVPSPTPSKGETPSGSIACPIQITDYRQRFDGNKVYIEGNVYNYGDSSYKNPKITCVRLYIFFYNKNGDVIGEESYTYNVGDLRYGEKYPFNTSANIRSGTERYLVKVRCCNR
ncbi:MAG: hypothetical protein APG12_01578 [Candidatus Methanofastidiosum methylothiophilum]|uniref:Uncharacterized protein n=1 Tax=Candidatus Methanofastidiosum methylothiophilum TaxID=1705564 RepID=A0A150INR8_9EURY|nr:MAG: hypothetical protein APG10_01720 [Candidatus Methanofastidiosum methylthiophilus]KYC46597.1 MAG: hypothetical protein APG11_01792 [Candidatus Methanofastidiosum methylthiophilus]KYC49278.1 MAG: hypothetical protein APG12_01578 [Candidatus Methanofastidiosum methylthiophilus]